MKRLGLIFGFLALAPVILSQGAMAAGTADAPLVNHDADKPVTITADAQDFDLKAKTVTYKGNVVAIQGANRLRADTMKEDQVANKLYVNGKVVLDSPARGTATGDNGVYDFTTKLVTLSGHVVLNKTGQATMRGSLLTVNMITDVAHLIGGPVASTANQAAAPGLPGGRVQGVFTPKAAGTSTGTAATGGN